MILIAAIVIGALAAYAVVTYVGGIEDRANDNARRVPVVRISGDIPRGTRGQEAIDQGLIEESEIASEFLPETAISPDALDTVLAKAAVADLATGQVLVENMFVDPIDSQITAARRIADGNVAITISVDDVRGVAGLIVPGDFVNVMVAADNVNCSGGEPEEGTPVPPTEGPQAALLLCRQARLLYQAVQVLFIDTSPIPLPGEAAAAAASAEDEDAPAAINTGLITLQVPAAASLLFASVPQDGFYLSLLPQTYTPQLVPPVDPLVTALPGEDPNQLTPYGPAGLSTDENP
jgi:Flp pilus assembly protein CpaB